jgi:hypothetical protein
MVTRSPRAVCSTLAFLLILGSGCGGGEDVTEESLARARRLWTRSGIHNYDLEWTSTAGMSSAHYRVSVRDGQVRNVESVLPDGRVVATRTAEPRYYGVEGLFMIIADERAQRSRPEPFGRPKGTTAILKFTPDAKLGYPRSYRRDVLGTPLPLAIDVIRFVPSPRP